MSRKNIDLLFILLYIVIMQAQIKITDKELSDELEQFKKENYPDMSRSQLFVRALVEKMKREQSK